MLICYLSYLLNFTNYFWHAVKFFVSVVPMNWTQLYGAKNDPCNWNRYYILISLGVSLCSYSIGGVVEHPISNRHLQKQLLLYTYRVTMIHGFDQMHLHSIYWQGILMIYWSLYHYFFSSFHTYSGLNACVNPKEGWVKKHLLFLR